MEIFVISIVAFAASGLSFFSGFGLGTVLTPVFVVFFPVEFAVAMTAIVHFLNNLFKLALVGKYANKQILVRFGIPAIVSAFIGAWMLVRISGMPPMARYTLGGHTFEIVIVKAVIGLLLITFALFEIIPSLSKWQVSSKYLPLGGFLSGFFGGLSGNQGALRSAFLSKSGLTKESFIGTGVVIACLVDIARLAIYTKHLATSQIGAGFSVLVPATLSAFLGAYWGNRLLKKVTMATIQYIVATLLITIGLTLGAGII